MLQKLSNSWELTKASLEVLRADKEMLLFPLFSFFGLVLSLAVFFTPMAVFGFGTLAARNLEVVGGVVAFVYWFVASVITIYFNSALVGAALIRLDGGDPTVADGLRVANRRLGSILGYAFVAASVGMILKMVRERSGALGRFVAGLLGVAWNLATFLVVPILVTREIGPIDALKESGRLLKRTWGEQIVGNFGIGAIAAVSYVVWGLAGIACIAASAQLGLPWLVGTLVALMVLGFCLLALAHATLSGIYSAALYRYATTGEVRGIDRRLLEGAFRQR